VILIIDNYDSFTYNLVQRIGEVCLASLAPGSAAGSMKRRRESRNHPRPEAGAHRGLPEIRVVRNDKITVEEAAALHPTHLILSPGPCTPTESGICPQLIEFFIGKIPILGVCLGHQTIGHVRGMTVKRHHTIMHGKTSEIHHDGRGIYEGLANPFSATRYHSLIVERDTVPPDFEVSAWTAAGEVMGLRWRGPLAPGFALGSNAGGRESRINPRPKAGANGHAPLDGVQFHPESFLTVEGPRLLANFLGVDKTR
jgi:anthranilate synthase/aminodeoxychorismate synthase-like glutamine amidotransferase